ncbi:Zn(2)-C6 fungal-type domain-containing protein [Mycena chlorophos]|uniref:Zn(2)-C6 fungal-type domain-containing protein n=1 Tax=Mycena chlorophos TaxID=658473 RepID=A0A8H6SVA4_MYCCL|nr:Zn(2)-C6 fungal-type domain-containing protein [Mycena chlorophos]
MKCDGAQPICGPCRRDNRPEDCEYTHGQRARAEMLEESITQVEKRIAELQSPRMRPVEDPNRVLLQAPYAGGPPTRTNWTAPPEPPMDMVEKLVDTFLLGASEFGFFLNFSRFRQRAVLHQATGSPHRPLPALLTVVYLWGLRLSKEPSLQAQEQVFLARALEQVASSLSAPHPDRVLHTLQAQILLAYYFYTSGRFLQGKYHASAAASLALSTGLHVRAASAALGPARTAVEDGERVHAWWAVVVLDATWAVALEENPNLDLAAQVDTPWPLEMQLYEKGQFNPSVKTTNTIRNFIQGISTSDAGTSTPALLAKAAILWQHAYTHRNAPGPVKTALEARIAQFITFLPLPTSFQGITPSMTRMLLVTHSMAHAAAIELGGHPGSARALLGIVAATASPPPGGAINPIMGTVWRKACRVLMDQMAPSRAYQAQDLELQTHLGRAIESMRRFAGAAASPLLEYQVARIEEAWQEILL